MNEKRTAAPALRGEEAETMAQNEMPETGGETPLERQLPPDEDGERIETRREEREADAVLQDVDQYIARNDPESLAAAEAELNAWEIPIDPLDLPAGQADLAGGQTGLASGAAFGGEAPESVAVASSEAEAHIIQGILEAAGIPARLLDTAMSAMGGIFASGDGAWGQVLVPASLAGQARQMIEEALRSAPQTT